MNCFNHPSCFIVTLRLYLSLLRVCVLLNNPSCVTERTDALFRANRQGNAMESEREKQSSCEGQDNQTASPPKGAEVGGQSWSGRTHTQDLIQTNHFLCYTTIFINFKCRNLVTFIMIRKPNLLRTYCGYNLNRCLINWVATLQT